MFPGQGKLLVSDIDRHGNIQHEPFYDWPGVDDSEDEIIYKTSDRPPNAYVRNDAKVILSESIAAWGHNGNRIKGIGAISNLSDARWRAAIEYLKQWEIETFQVGDPNHDAGTFVGPLHNNLKELSDNVLYHRIPIPTPPPQ